MFKNKNILIIGDVMLDSYLFGNVERISPEAPVPIIDITQKQYKLGGAANVAANIKNLGGNPLLCSIIGKDTNGDVFLSLLKNIDVSIDYIYQNPDRLTTNKTRIIGNNHQMLRMDEEIKDELELNDQIYLLILINKVINNQKIDCIIIEDYDKGIITKKIIEELSNISKILNIPILVDPKKKNFSNYKNIKLFKPNFKEFKEGLNLIGSDKEKILEIGAKILHERGIEIVFITLSENGIFVSYKNEDLLISKIIPGTARNVADVSGAGDTVVAVTSMLLNDIHIEEIANLANLAGGIVCEEVGVVPIDKEKLLKEYYESKN